MSVCLDVINPMQPLKPERRGVQSRAGSVGLPHSCVTIFFHHDSHNTCNSVTRDPRQQDLVCGRIYLRRHDTIHRDILSASILVQITLLNEKLEI